MKHTDKTNITNTLRTTQFLLSISVAICLLGNVHAQPIIWETSAGGNGHAYEPVVVAGGINWTNARNAAIARGGDLTSITSAEENAFVFSLIMSNDLIWRSESGYTLGPWLGGFQQPGSQEPAAGWTWVSGEDMSFTAWESSEPNNNVPNSDFIHFFAHRGDNNPQPFWNDSPGDWLYNGYVVEYLQAQRTDLAASIFVSCVDICWQGLTNRQYQVQYSSTLTTNTWVNWGGPVWGTGTNCVTDSIRGTGKRFYRVVDAP